MRLCLNPMLRALESDRAHTHAYALARLVHVIATPKERATVFMP